MHRSKFLSAGIVYDRELFPSAGTGISEGSNLSPYLANFTLDGMQKKVYETLHGTTSPLDYANGNLLRFADDVLVTVRTQEAAQIVRKRFQIVHCENSSLSLTYGPVGARPVLTWVH